MQLVPIQQSGEVHLQGADLPDISAGVIEAACALYARKGFAPPWILFIPTAILQKLGFALQGPVQHPEDGVVWEWQWAAA